MPDNVISRVEKLAYNEPNRFIFTDHRSSTIGNIDITGVDRDAYDSNENKAPQYPSHKFQATEET